MARTHVTPGTVAAYIARTVSETNYHFFYGLHLLGHDRFIRVADGLLNGDFQPEELIRLGSFTDAEADAFLEESAGHWVGLGRPGVGSDGYAYLTRELGLGSLLREASEAVPGPNPHRVAGIRIPIGGTAGHASAASVRERFERLVLPAVLEASGGFFPPTSSQLSDRWRGEAFGTLGDWATDPTALFLGLGDEPSGLSEVPGLLQWIAEEPRPSPRTALLLRREAVTRSVLADPTYGDDELATMLGALETAVLSPAGTSRLVAALDFRSRLVRAALVGRSSELVERADAVGLALDELHACRDRVRAGLLALLTVAPKTIYGHYPPA